MPKRHRVIGTTAEAIECAESALGFSFPPSFRAWLLENNGLKGIFPVEDARDPRTAAGSIVREYRSWREWLSDFEDGEYPDSAHLLPFANVEGDYHCFDFSRMRADGECPVVRWSHETGERETLADQFNQFLENQRFKTSVPFEPEVHFSNRKEEDTDESVH